MGRQNRAPTTIPRWEYRSSSTLARSVAAAAELPALFSLHRQAQTLVPTVNASPSCSAHIRIAPTIEERGFARYLIAPMVKPATKRSDEEIIDTGNWHARDRACRHHRAPEVDIAPHKESRYADTHRMLDDAVMNVTP
jgi:hypothetical protein